MRCLDRVFLTSMGTTFIAASGDISVLEDWWVRMGFKIILTGIGMIFFYVALKGLKEK